MLKKTTIEFVQREGMDLCIDDLHEMSMEDLMLSLEQSYSQIDRTIEDLLNDLDLHENGEESLEAYSERYRTFIINDEYSQEAEVGGMSKFLTRFAQIYSLEFKNTWETWVSLFKELEGKADKEIEHTQKVMEKFKKIKPTLSRDKHLTSYAGLMPWWLTGDGFVTDIFRTLEIDRELTHHAAVEYPTSVLEQDGKVLAAFGRSNGDATELSRVFDRMRHPAELFDRKYLSEKRQYMIQTRADYSKKPELPDDPIKKLKYKLRVKIDTADVSRATRLIPDVQLTTRDIDQLLDADQWYLQLIKKYVANRRDQQSQLRTLMSTMEKVSETMRKHNAPSKQFKTMLAIHKTHLNCATQTSHEAIKRALRMARGIRYLATRGIKAAS